MNASELTMKITTDTTELDEAILKMKEYRDLLKEVEELREKLGAKEKEIVNVPSVWPAQDYVCQPAVVTCQTVPYGNERCVNVINNPKTNGG